MLSHVCLISFPFVLLMALIAWTQGRRVEALVLSAVGGFLVLVPGVARRRRDTVAAGHLLGALIYLATWMIGLRVGEFPDHVLIWSAVIPLGAFLMKRRLAAFVWTVLVLGQLGAFVWMAYRGLLPNIAAPLHQEAVAVFGVVLLLIALGWLNYRLQERMRREHERLTFQLGQAGRLESVAQVAAGVTHEFNNLLTVIEGYASLLSDALDPTDPTYEDVSEIQKASRRGADLTQQLLAFTRQQKTRPELLDVSEQVGALEPLARRVCGDSIEVKVVRPAGLPPVLADRGQLSRAILNLVLNSRDAMPTGGRLYIEARLVEVDEQRAARHLDMKPGRFVQVSITDTGAGIPPELLDRIYEPFFTTKSRGQGTGLGLSTTYGIVRQAGGHLHAYSEQDVGTTFKIYLPEAVPQRRTAAPEPGRPEVQRRPSVDGEGPSRANRTVLVVDDQPALARSARRLLERAGYEVLIATSPEEVRNVWRQSRQSIDLLLTDVVMPGLSGPDLALQLRAERPDLRVLFMSGYSAAMVQDLLEGDGAPIVLEKPFGPTELLAHIRLVLGEDDEEDDLD